MTYVFSTYLYHKGSLCLLMVLSPNNKIKAALEKKGKVIDGLLLLPRHIYLRDVQYLICMHGACRLGLRSIIVAIHKIRRKCNGQGSKIDQNFAVKYC